MINLKKNKLISEGPAESQATNKDMQTEGQVLTQVNKLKYLPCSIIDNHWGDV